MARLSLRAFDEKIRARVTTKGVVSVSSPVARSSLHRCYICLGFGGDLHTGGIVS